MRLFPARPIRMEARPVTPIRMEGCNLIYKSEMRFLPLPPIRMEGCDLIYKSEMRVMPAPPIRMEGCDLIYHEVPSYSTNQKWGCCLFYQSEWRLCPIQPIRKEVLACSTNQKAAKQSDLPIRKKANVWVFFTDGLFRIRIPNQNEGCLLHNQSDWGCHLLNQSEYRLYKLFHY